MTVKEHVENGQKVFFKFFQNGILFYETEKGLSFEVPIIETGTGRFLPEQKAIQFMKWIKPAVELYNKSSKVKIGSFVIVREDGSFILPQLKQWIEKHKERKFYVENSDGSSSKLSKVDFWISNNFLIEV